MYKVKKRGINMNAFKTTRYYIVLWLNDDKDDLYKRYYVYDKYDITGEDIITLTDDIVYGTIFETQEAASNFWKQHRDNFANVNYRRVFIYRTECEDLDTIEYKEW